MKKYGFTLAEVLITLGIIGVITALTMPTFTQSTQSAKVGPQLAKAVASYEQAAKAILTEADADFLNGAYVCPRGNSNCSDTQKQLMTSDPTFFWGAFERYLNGNNDSTGEYFTTQDGVSYVYSTWSFRTPATTDSPIPKEVPLLTDFEKFLVIDLNGANKGPNKDGKDLFYFTAWNDGSLRPVGSIGWNASYAADNPLWSDTGKCPKNLVPGDAKFCAGHIFANGLKAEYK